MHRVCSSSLSEVAKGEHLVSQLWHFQGTTGAILLGDYLFLLYCILLDNMFGMIYICCIKIAQIGALTIGNDELDVEPVRSCYTWRLLRGRGTCG
jgi:hypothetical protein